MEWSEQEEQEMIERAKEGDPKANYELSLWALSRSEEEPDEPRWNRLAAKCLVKAAQAGYAPAQKRMNELLAARASKPAPEEQPPVQEPVRLSDVRSRSARGPVQPASTARRPASRRAAVREEPDDFADEQDDLPLFDDEEDYDDAPARRSAPAKKPRSPRKMTPISQWGDAQWRKLELVCMGVCALLLVIIGVMVITGRSGRGSAANNSTSIPPAMAAEPAASPTQEPVQYPDDETRRKIEAADLSIYPADGDYMTVPTTATVKVGSTTLRLRKGPNTDYSQLARMPDGTNVNVYAAKDDWCLVLYEDGEDGPVYGWCSSEYLLITTGAASGGIG